MKKVFLILLVLIGVSPFVHSQNRLKDYNNVDSLFEYKDKYTGFQFIYAKLNNGKGGIFSQDWKLIIPCIYNSIWYSQGDELFFAKDDKGYESCYKKNGRCVIDENSHYTTIYPYTTGGKLIGFKVYMDVTNSGVWGESNLKGWGMCNLKGEQVIPPVYDDVRYLPKYGTFLVKLKNKLGVRGVNGDVIVKCAYSNLSYDSYLQCYCYQKDSVWYVANGKYMGKSRVAAVEAQKEYEEARQQARAEAVAGIFDFIGKVTDAIVSPSSSTSTSTGSYYGGGTTTSNGSYDSSASSETNTKSSSSPRPCSMCNGTGKVIKSSGAAQFGLTEKYCEICNKKVPGDHIHGQCPSCRGKGHM